MFGSEPNKTAKNMVYAKHIMDELQATNEKSLLSELGPVIIDLLMAGFYPHTREEAIQRYKRMSVYDQLSTISMALNELYIRPAIGSRKWENVRRPFVYSGAKDMPHRFQKYARKFGVSYFLPRGKYDSLVSVDQQAQTNVSLPEQRPLSFKTLQLSGNMPDFTKATTIGRWKAETILAILVKDAKPVSESLGAPNPFGMRFDYAMMALSELNRGPFYIVTLERNALGSTAYICVFNSDDPIT